MSILSTTNTGAQMAAFKELAHLVCDRTETAFSFFTLNETMATVNIWLHTTDGVTKQEIIQISKLTYEREHIHQGVESRLKMTAAEMGGVDWLKTLSDFKQRNKHMLNAAL